MVRENPADSARDNSLFEQNFPSIIFCQVQHSNALVVAILLSWVFSVANRHHTVADIHIVPRDFTDFFQSHCGSDSKPDHATNWYELPRLFVKVTIEII